ncbi:MAG: TolC family protein [Bacteroidia bacterium]|nr:TolC family protein [Bacteroidia bacterium]
MRKKIYPVFTPLWLFFILTPVFSYAQTTGLEDYVKTGLENNRALKNRELSYQKSVQALREAKGLFMPQVSFSASYTVANGGRAIQFPIGDLLNPIYATLNALTETQNFPTNLENVDEQFLPNNFQETKFRVIQPLFNPDIYLNYKAKKSLISIAEAQQAAYSAELAKDIRIAYYNYQKTEDALAIYRETETLIREIIRVNQRLLEHHKTTPDAVSRAETELAQLKEQEAQAIEQNQTAKAYFNFLLNRPLAETIIRDTLIQRSVPVVGLEQALNQSIINRAELDQLTSAKEAGEYALRINRAASLPRVVAVVDAGAQGYGYAFDKDQRFWLGQVSLQWDLFKGFQNDARVQQAEIDQTILYNQENELQQQIQLQVQQAWYQVQAAQTASLATEKAVKSARETFEHIRKRYQENQASLLELMDARNQLTQARLNLNIHTWDYHSKVAELNWAAAI